MACLKCGREAQSDEVFCPECLAAMAQYPPIKPGTPVNLPQRSAQRKAPLVKSPKPEQIISQLYKKIRRLRAAVAVLIVLLCLSLGAMGFALYQANSEPDIGSNYNTAATIGHTTR